MDAIADLQPAALWRAFAELSRIPRPSGQEGAAADWVAQQGRDLGLQVERDAAGNVLIRKPAAPGQEGRPTVALQAHCDMVCEKNEGTAHDFTKDPIRLRREGDLLWATGTTLGADNGIGVAAGLAVMAATDLRHGPLELLVTVDEESGLTGANQLQPGWLRATVLLNLDSEEEGYVTIGCAGGIDSVANRKVRWEAIPEGMVALRLKVHGLKGGHSGIDIQAGRANAIRLLAQVLDQLEVPFRLASAHGGNKRNAIPREASAILLVAPADAGAVRAAAAAGEAAWRSAFGSIEPGLALSVDLASATRVMSASDADALQRLLLALPHGVEAMSPDIPGLVQTSTNLGVLATSEEGLQVNLLSRSSIETSKMALARRIAGACALAGFEHHLEGGYPGWKPEPGAPIVGLVTRTWEELSGNPMKVMAIHAGLECGLIGTKYPGMQMASIGPSMWDVHTPDEHVSIPSVATFWGLLRAILERI